MAKNTLACIHIRNPVSQPTPGDGRPFQTQAVDVVLLHFGGSRDLEGEKWAGFSAFGLFHPYFRGNQHLPFVPCFFFGQRGRKTLSETNMTFSHLKMGGCFRRSGFLLGVSKRPIC